MSGLAGFLRRLERAGELRRVSVPVQARFEIAEIVARTTAQRGPALLFERVEGSTFAVAANLLASPRRLELALGRPPGQVGAELAGAAERLQPPTPRALWRERGLFVRALRARTRRVRRAPCQEVSVEPDLDALPILTSWPDDGGRFITWPMVLTQHPLTGGRNLGTYRMHVFDRRTTGMHMQIQKGGGFHYHEAEARGAPLPLCCLLGGDPVLMLASVAPLPENVDELAFAAFLRGAPLPVTRAVTVPLEIPAEADFVLEGAVPPFERRLEGPFGDHFGHYSHAAEYPVFHLSRMTHRRDAIFPVSVVGQPPQEDLYIGDALQEMMVPLARLMHPEVRDVWAYAEAGFHNLLAVSVAERYEKEALKAVFGLLGTGQVSLSKVVITVGPGVDARDPEAVLRAVAEHFDPSEDFLLLPGTAMDTLDFTSFRPNLGSKMILDAVPKRHRPPRPPVDPGVLAGLERLHPGILRTRLVAAGLLAVATRDGTGPEVLTTLLSPAATEVCPPLARVPLLAVVSDDVRLDDRTHLLWGIFTRFDAARDVRFRDSKLVGAAPVHRGTLGIDATWKPGYPPPVVASEETRQRVDRRWGEYRIDRKLGVE